MVTCDTSLDELRDWDFDKSYLSTTALVVPDNKEIDAYAIAQRSFAERVTLLETKNNLSTYLVDQRILVHGPSDAMRAHAIKNWEGQKETSTWWSRFHILVVLGSLVFVGAIAKAFPLLAAAGTASAIANALFSSNHKKQAAHAETQERQWNKHPAQSIADMRAKAYSSNDGFFFAISNRLKGNFSTVHVKNILHPSEVTWLYEQALTGMLKDAACSTSPNDKAEWTIRFVTQNLLSFQSIDYAYEPQDLKTLALGFYAPYFEVYKQNVLTAAKPFNERANTIRSEARLRIESLKKQILVPYMMSNQRLYASTYAPYPLTYIPQSNPFYERDKKAIEKWESDQLKEIQREKEAELAPYFERGRDLLKAAYGRLEKQIDIIPMPSPLFAG